MSVSRFNHVAVKGVKTALPEKYIDIENEVEFFGGSVKKVERQKKMIGYGRRYVADDQTTVVDLAVDAAEHLIVELQIDRSRIEGLVFVNQHPDYIAPADACIAHGRLNLKKDVPAISISQGCSGYAYALWTAHMMIECGSIKNCLVLSGDLPSRCSSVDNRKTAPVFGDAASATWLERSDSVVDSTFVLGTDGSGWDKIVTPIGGLRLPFSEDVVNLKVVDQLGNPWTSNQGVMAGEEVFAFTMEVSPKLIKDTMAAAGWVNDEVELFAIHQANKQILEMIVSQAGIPAEKAPIDVFSKYANNSTNSVVTVICDQTKPLGKTVLCTFGIGLSWGGAALDLSGCYNGGISTYHPPAGRPTRQQQIEHWVERIKNS